MYPAGQRIIRKEMSTSAGPRCEGERLGRGGQNIYCRVPILRTAENVIEMG